MGAPLSGIRVVDLSRLLPGPLASLILNDLGAEVTSVDSAHNPDYMHSVPPYCDDGVSLFFHALHRDKKRVSLDLRADEGKAQLRLLLSTADVLIESYRPGVLSSFGFDDTTLSAQFPRLIVCHLSGYGQKSDMANTAGHDINFLAESGLLGIFDPPQGLAFPIADIAAGSFGAVMQIMAAILQRQTSNAGSIIDHNITAFCAALAMPQWATIGNSEQLRPIDAAYVLDGHQPAYSVYATRDGYIAIGALEPKFWRQLIEALGVPELAHLGISGKEQAKETKARLQAIFLRKTAKEWENELKPLNICVSRVRDFNDPLAVKIRGTGVTLKSITMRGMPVEVPRLPFFSN